MKEFAIIIRTLQLENLILQSLDLALEISEIETITRKKIITWVFFILKTLFIGYLAEAHYKIRTYLNKFKNK